MGRGAVVLPAWKWIIEAPAASTAAASRASSAGVNGTFGLTSRGMYSLARTSMMSLSIAAPRFLRRAARSGRVD